MLSVDGSAAAARLKLRNRVFGTLSAYVTGLAQASMTGRLLSAPRRAAMAAAMLAALVCSSLCTAGAAAGEFANLSLGTILL